MVNQQGETPAPEQAARPRRRRRWRRLRDWPVRGRLVALIVVPTVVAIALGVIGVTAAVQSATGDRHARTLGQLGGQLTELVAKVQDEQAASAAYVAGGRADPAPMQSAYQAVDAASSAPLQTLTTDIDDDYPATTQNRARTAAFRIHELRNLRATVQGSRLPAGVVIDKYTDVVTEILALNDEIAAETADPSLVASVRALGAVSRAKTELGVQRSLVAAAITARGFDLGGLAALNDAIAAQQSAFQEFQLAATGPQSQQYAFVVTGKDVDGTQTVLNQVTSSNGDWLRSAPPSAAQSWNTAVTGTLGKIRQVEQGLIGEITARSSTLADDAIRQAVIAGVVALAVLIVVLIATSMVARSLVRPLRALRGGALTVAEDRLPTLVARLHTEAPSEVPTAVAPIEVDSADEIGQVARAFDEVHRVAAELAGEQARLRGQVNALFVGLSRRSQTLVERQLEVIDSLEQEEQDPDRLQNLFTLDHLATRMRRNGENLLVLGGQEPSRRFTEAMPLFDVLRAAASEIERYERVQVDLDLPDVFVADSAVTDLVHLVAELLDNATAFSPPDEPVRVRARQTADAHVLVEITDRGIGLADQDREAANADLDDPPMIQPGVSRHMGLFVVARLAHRHGIAVRLTAGEPHGLTVLVGLPPDVAARGLAPRPQVPPAAPAAEEPPPVPGWPGQRFVAAMTASRAGAGSWFGAEPLPTIDPSGRAPAGPPSGQQITAGGQTPVGLPQRVPGANYVPGSLTEQPGAEQPGAAQAGTGQRGAEPAPAQQSWEQSPEALRSRFAAYQTGARRGHAAGRHAAPDPAPAAHTAPAYPTTDPDRPAAAPQAGFTDADPAPIPVAQPRHPHTPMEQPTASQPTGIQPTGTQPAGARPPGAQPSGTQPSGTQPSGTQPDGTQPTQPDGTQPGGPIHAAGQTPVGLPQRVPGANYLPGSLPQRAPGEFAEPPAARPPQAQQPQPQQPQPQQPQPQPPQAQPPQPEPQPEQNSWEQSPDALRARFAAFQSGSRRGHAAAGGGAWVEPGRSEHRNGDQNHQREPTWP